MRGSTAKSIIPLGNLAGPLPRNHMKTEVTRIKRLMRENQMSTADLAVQLNVTRQNVYRWLNGSKPIPRKRIDQLAEVFGKHPSTIMFDSPTTIDREFLRTVIEIVMEKKTELNVEVTNSDLARICSLLYETGKKQSEHNAKGHKPELDTSLAIELVRLAS